MRPLGYQLFSSRHFRPVSDTIRMLSELGYAHVEGYGGQFRHGPDISELKASLKAYGLSMPSIHFGLEKLQMVPDKILAIARAFDVGQIVVQNIPPGQKVQTKDDWRQFSEDISDAAHPLRNAGIQVSYHQKDAELRTLPDGDTPLSIMLETDKDRQIEFDVGWAHRANKDPAKEIATYAERIRAVHVKDVVTLGQNIQEDGWADIGQGLLNWSEIWDVLNRCNVPMRIVEHNNPADHWRFARRSIEALRALDRMTPAFQNYA